MLLVPATLLLEVAMLLCNATYGSWDTILSPNMLRIDDLIKVMMVLHLDLLWPVWDCGLFKRSMPLRCGEQHSMLCLCIVFLL